MATKSSANIRGRMRDWRFVMVVVATCLSMCTAGCFGSSSPDDNPQTRTDAVLQTDTERGPVRVTVQAHPAKPRLSDEVTLTLTISAQDSVQVTPPAFIDAFEDFVVRDFHEPLTAPDPSSDRRVIQQVYTLEPVRAGHLTISPFLIQFSDTVKSADSDNTEAHTVQTEPLQIDVSTLLKSEAPSLTDLRPPADPVELPGEFNPWLVWGVVLAGAILAAILWFGMRRRERIPVPPQWTPCQLAHQELERLMAMNLSEADVKAFYLELTAIVRRLIERTTGIRAPEQTTEEFLREIVTRNTFLHDEQVRLRSFLESADLVKFAGVQPDPEDVESSLAKAREFIDRRESTDAAVGMKEPA